MQSTLRMRRITRRMRVIVVARHFHSSPSGGIDVDLKIPNEEAQNSHPGLILSLPLGDSVDSISHQAAHRP